MDFTLYLDEFQQAAERLDKKILNKKQIEVAVGIYLDSVFLKLFKRRWANKSLDPLTVESRIFFSVWVNDPIISEQKIFYNIHALKLRKLDGYSIASRIFADNFRKKFKPFEHQWPNVGMKFGPQTLIEGWINVNIKNYPEKILELANQFLELDYLIDDTLELFKK